jgi:hypothetical protein
MKRILIAGAMLALLVLALVVGGCSENNSPAAGTTNNFSLSFAAPGAAAAAKAVAPDTIIAGTDTLVLTNVQVVLKHIELQAVRDSAATDSLGCQEFAAGPLLVDMPLGGDVAQAVSVDVPPGTYNQVEFNIHPVRGEEADAAAFLAAHPEFAGVAIRADGFFNGTAFTFTTRRGAHEETDLEPPLVVTADGGPVNVTLQVDHTMWFVGPDSSLIDPSTANADGENQRQVDRNIRRSFHAFQDRDCDGRDDHHGDPDGGHGHHGGGGHH